MFSFSQFRDCESRHQFNLIERVNRSYQFHRFYFTELGSHPHTPNPLTSDCIWLCELFCNFHCFFLFCRPSYWLTRLQSPHRKKRRGKDERNIAPLLLQTEYRSKEIVTARILFWKKIKIAKESLLNEKWHLVASNFSFYFWIAWWDDVYRFYASCCNFFSFFHLVGCIEWWC